MKNKSKAFTLAEVLITLAVIGVVAAMTIPALISKTNESKLYTKWKKNYSVLSNAVRVAQANGGNIDFTTRESLRSSLGNALSYVVEDTWANLSGEYYNYYKNDSAGWDSSTSTKASAILVDGSTWRFDLPSFGYCTNTRGSLTGICGMIFIDVNAKKAPNMFGKDLFFAWIVKENGGYVVYPYGSHGDGMSCEAGSTEENTSFGCAAKALYKDPDYMP